MINLEQVKLLETKVVKAIGFVEEFARENASLRKKEAELETRLETYQKRIDELEVLVMRFKEDQGRIEDAILSALDRLNQFEEALEKSLWDKPLGSSAVGASAATKADGAAEKPSNPSPAAKQSTSDSAPALEEIAPSDNGKTCFEIPSEAWRGVESVLPEAGDDIADPVDDILDEVSLSAAKSLSQQTGELDIF